MSQNKNKYYRKKSNNQKSRSDKSNDIIDESNPIIACFQAIALELDDKHDRYERIVKLSRDITIESKRIIFFLHTVDLRNEETSKTILSDAKSRLVNLFTNNFITIAKELDGLDPYQYARAYSAGLQEFIEAYTFYQYISKEDLSDWDILQEKMTYKKEMKMSLEADEANIEKIENIDLEEISNKKIQCLIQPTEYILGLADMSGEVMRRGINSLGNGNLNVCFDSSQFLQQLYMGYVKITGLTHSREMSRKITTLRQSLLKTEMVCYNIKVRGGEAAKWGLESSTHANDALDEDDEGFY